MGAMTHGGIRTRGINAVRSGTGDWPRGPASGGGGDASPGTAMALDLTFVTPRLAVGGHVAVEDLPALAALGIRRVVDVRVEMVDDEALLLSHGIALLHLPTLDRCAVSQEMLDEGARW